MKIASIRGIDLKIHVSLVFLLVYVVLVSSLQFPFVAANAGLNAQALFGGPLFWGVVFAVGLFVSVAMHEFAHALTAQRQGVKVRGITLMMLGGVSEMEEMPERPYGEFALAVVGPLLSLGLAAILLSATRVLDSPNPYFFCYWLGRANLVLGIFNLLPAFPLDGGRALRSLIAARRGQIAATQTAVRISRGFAWALGLVALLNFNILLMLIAFFIYSASQRELFLLLSKNLLQGLRAADVAIHHPPVHEDESLATAADRMLQSRSTVLPVLTNRGSPALLGLADIRRVPRQEWETVHVRDLAVACSRSVKPEDPIIGFLNELIAAPFSSLPLQANGTLLGVVRYSDVNEVIAFRSLQGPESTTQGEERQRKPPRAA